MTSATSADSIWRRLWYTRWRDVLRGRLDARLDWRQLITGASLPPELAEAVTQVVGGSRLWRNEKAAIASELVAHFQDGLAAGQSPEQLLTAFGNTKDASQLIRRAKRRNRSLAWHVWHYGWISLATLLFAYFGISLWMAAGRPTVRVDYSKEINRIAAAVPENERAWPLYREAFLEMKKDYKAIGAPTTFVYEVKPGDTKWAENEKFLTDHADSIDELRQAASLQRLGFVSSPLRIDLTHKDRELFDMHLTPEDIEAEKKRGLDERWLISTLLPDLQYLRDAARLLAGDARRAALANDGDTAYADITAIFGVSRHAQESPILIGVAVAEAIQGVARIMIRDIMGEKPKLWSDAQLRDLAHELSASRVDWIRGFEGERALFYDSMQRIYTDDGNGDGRLALRVAPDKNLFQLLASINGGEGATGDSLLGNSTLAMLTLPAANMVVASRKNMIESFDNATNNALSRLAEPYWKQRDKPSLDEFLFEENSRLGKFKYLFVRMLTPAYEKILVRTTGASSELNGLFIGLALEAFHRKHSKWPNTLDELAPQYLPQVPLDLITGQPLHYKISDDRPVVYSVGLDGDDDGGRGVPEYSAGFTVPWDRSPTTPPDDGDWVLWSTVPMK